MIRRLTIFFCICLFFTSCEKEAVDYGLGEYYVEIVTALNDNAFRLDTGKTIYNTNKETYKDFKEGDRVYLNFSYLENDQIAIHGASKISSGELKAVAQNDFAGYADDPVRLESAWLGSHYLNILFYMDYKSVKHTIALITGELQKNDPEVNLYFRHDKKDDPAGYPTKVYVSFDLSKVLGEPQGDRTVHVRFNTTNYGDKTCEFKY
jgi:hypothetical protein